MWCQRVLVQWWMNGAFVEWQVCQKDDMVTQILFLHISSKINVENFNRNSKLSDETFLTRFIVSPCCAPQINWANHPKALGLVVVLVFCRQLMKISILPLRLASSGFSETIQPHSAPYDHSDSQQNDQTSPLFDSSMAPCNSSCHW